MSDKPELTPEQSHDLCFKEIREVLTRHGFTIITRINAEGVGGTGDKALVTSTWRLAIPANGS